MFIHQLLKMQITLFPVHILALYYISVSQRCNVCSLSDMEESNVIHFLLAQCTDLVQFLLNFCQRHPLQASAAMYQSTGEASMRKLFASLEGLSQSGGFGYKKLFASKHRNLRLLNTCQDRKEYLTNYFLLAERREIRIMLPRVTFCHKA